MLVLINNGVWENREKTVTVNLLYFSILHEIVG